MVLQKKKVKAWRSGIQMDTGEVRSNDTLESFAIDLYIGIFFWTSYETKLKFANIEAALDYEIETVNNQQPFRKPTRVTLMPCGANLGSKYTRECVMTKN
jgi:hypothetical protein